MTVFLGISLGIHARADVIGVGPSAFPALSTVVDFTGLPTNREVNGLTVAGVRFDYTVAGAPLNGAVVIDGGPGVTNNVSPPNIVSVGNNTGILNITLPSAVNLLGYGFAILNGVTIANATSVSAFSGSTLLGSVSFTGRPDPGFTGGFAGISSTTAFNRVALTFNSAAAPAFAVDNVRFASIPEPSTLALVLGVGVLFLAGALRSRIRRR
ncbi:MAG: PEP-CTERM sorting domain-containing protein [Bryobacteraceae bacterium]